MILRTFKSLPYPQNLLSTIFGKEIPVEQIPVDWEETLNYILSTLKHPKRAESLIYYFKDGYTWEEIGIIYDYTLEAPRYNATKALPDLRQPLTSWLLYYGLAKAKSMEENRLGYWSIYSPINGNDPATIPIAALELSQKAFIGLRRLQIKTVLDLLKCTEKDLLKARLINEPILQEINEKLSLLNRSLACGPTGVLN